MTKTIIFDFDGTIADTFNNVVDIFNRVCHEYNAKPIDKNNIEILRNGNYKQLMKEHNISIFKFPKLIRRIQMELKNEIGTVKPHPGLIDEIQNLKSAGFTLGILTSNSQENVDKFLNSHNLANLFEFSESYKKLFGKDKMLKKIIKSRGLDNSNVIYVGDEVRDIKASSKAKIKSIAVSWGFNSRNVLINSNPDILIDKVEELIPAAQKLIS